MCDFKPGDEVEKFKEGAARAWSWPGRPPIGTVAVVAAVHHVPGTDLFGLDFIDWPPSVAPYGYAAENWRKVQRRKTSLSIEAFLTIKPGFEEPKRAPAKQRERA